MWRVLGSQALGFVRSHDMLQSWCGKVLEPHAMQGSSAHDAIAHGSSVVRRRSLGWRDAKVVQAQTRGCLLWASLEGEMGSQAISAFDKDDIQYSTVPRPVVGRRLAAGGWRHRGTTEARLLLAEGWPKPRKRGAIKNPVEYCASVTHSFLHLFLFFLSREMGLILVLRIVFN